MFGFLFGSTLAGAGTYYYILEEYRTSNELLTEDIYSVTDETPRISPLSPTALIEAIQALQAAVQRIHSYVTSLEDKVAVMEKRNNDASAEMLTSPPAVLLTKPVKPYPEAFFWVKELQVALLVKMIQSRGRWLYRKLTPGKK
ncbi:MAG: hypothetical protein Q9191_000304 [Dirinaria sp. TL-2023a]